MTLEVIGLGVGRTGTYSLKLALEQLGFGPCHHMEEVDWRSARELQKWKLAASGQVNWAEAYSGFRAAVDWPTAAFSEDLVAAFPDARFLLTVRDPDGWYESYSQTIQRLVDPNGDSPAELGPFNDMVRTLMRKTGFEVQSGRQSLIAAFHRHTAHVRSVIPEDRLLIFEVAQGWGPLCKFLGVPTPHTPFPRTNNTDAFWESVRMDVATQSAVEAK